MAFKYFLTFKFNNKKKTKIINKVLHNFLSHIFSLKNITFFATNNNKLWKQAFLHFVKNSMS